LGKGLASLPFKFFLVFKVVELRLLILNDGLLFVVIIVVNDLRPRRFGLLGVCFGVAYVLLVAGVFFVVEVEFGEIIACFGLQRVIRL
jgi:hypothetical protein